MASHPMILGLDGAVPPPRAALREGRPLPAPAAGAAPGRPLHAPGPVWRDRLLAWPLPLAVLLLWALATRYQWVAPQVLPAPQAVAATLGDSLASGELWGHLRISLLRVLGGYALGLAGGLALGGAMGLSPTVKDYLHPLFKAFSQVPVLGWLPLLMLLVGIDEALKFILIAKAALVPVALNTMQGIENVPTRYIEVGRVLGYTRRQMLTQVVFPAALGPVWNGVRYGLTNAWLALVVVELVASSEGVGFMIVYGRQLFQLDVVLAAVAAVGAIGYALDRGLAGIECRLLRWRTEAC
jgi:sulfonate transport system permease protein